jgi:hypothetical protein
MNNDLEELVEMAKAAGFFVADGEAYSPSNQADHELTEFLERFANLVAAHEREECIKLVHEGTGYPVQIKTLVILQKERKRIADAIRERGTT